MSGKPWTAEMKAAHRKAMRKRWRNGVFDKRRPATITAKDRAARSARMTRLNIRMRLDDKLRNRCTTGQRRVRRDPAYRSVQAAVMADMMVKRPELREMARAHCIAINKDAKVRKRQWAGRRRKKAAL